MKNPIPAIPEGQFTKEQAIYDRQLAQDRIDAGEKYLYTDDGYAIELLYIVLRFDEYIERINHAAKLA